MQNTMSSFNSQQKMIHAVSLESLHSQTAKSYFHSKSTRPKVTSFSFNNRFQFQ